MMCRPAAHSHAQAAAMAGRRERGHGDGDCSGKGVACVRVGMRQQRRRPRRRPGCVRTGVQRQLPGDDDRDELLLLPRLPVLVAPSAQGKAPAEHVVAARHDAGREREADVHAVSRVVLVASTRGGDRPEAVHVDADVVIVDDAELAVEHPSNSTAKLWLLAAQGTGRQRRVGQRHYWLDAACSGGGYALIKSSEVVNNVL